MTLKRFCLQSKLMSLPPEAKELLGSLRSQGKQQQWYSISQKPCDTPVLQQFSKSPILFGAKWTLQRSLPSSTILCHLTTGQQYLFRRFRCCWPMSNGVRRNNGAERAFSGSERFRVWTAVENSHEEIEGAGRFFWIFSIFFICYFL